MHKRDNKAAIAAAMLFGLIAGIHEPAEADTTQMTVQAQVPVVIDEIRRLKSEGEGAGQSAERLQTIVDQAVELASSAQQVNASHTATFFTGLHSFLTIVMEGRVAVTPPRYEAVESRLLESVKALQAWVEAGRVERSAIVGILQN